MRIILDIPIQLSDVFRLCHPPHIDPRLAQIQILAITTDSRMAEDGDLFFALASDSKACERHISDAMSRGAFTVGEKNSGALIEVSSVRGLLLSLASFYLSLLPNLKHRVGITGSYGKTTLTRFLGRILAKSFAVSATIGNFNNDIGVSLSVLSAPRFTEIILVEIGMNHRGEIKEIAEAICPDICIITAIGTSHIGNLGSREAIAEAKLEILTDSCRYLICPENEPLLYGVQGRVGFSFGRGGDFELSLSDNGLSMKSPVLSLCGIKAEVSGEIAYAALAPAIATAILLKQPEKELRDGIIDVSPSDMRAQALPLGTLTVIDDSYNSSPEAAFAALSLLSEHPGPRFALLGDMLELGAMADELHRELGRRAAGVADRIYAIGRYAESMKQGAVSAGFDCDRIRVINEHTPLSQLGDLIKDECTHGTLLIKGSHATGLHELYGILKKRCEND